MQNARITGVVRVLHRLADQLVPFGGTEVRGARPDREHGDQRADV